MTYQLKSFSNIDDISIDASLKLSKEKITLHFLLKGALEAYCFPKAERLERADELWKATCFELFLADEHEVYYELNFSSSFAWNFYVLDAYRGEAKALGFQEIPYIASEHQANKFHLMLR